MNTFLQDIAFLKNIKNGIVGIMGGSFNPPHQGHLYIANLAIQKLNLNLLLWLVTPVNPLKDSHILLPLSKRLNLCNNLINKHPKIKISSLEYDLHINYTYNTINILTSLLSKNIKLIWIMGEDLLFSFHKFYKWKDLTKLINFVIISRGGISSFVSLSQKYPHIMRKYFINSEDISSLKTFHPPCWTFWNLPKMDISSTQIRNHF